MNILSEISRTLKIASLSLNSMRWLNIIKGLVLSVAVLAAAWSMLRVAMSCFSKK
ncbi:MAG: hypothetical protein IJF40_02110 [Clostridia bacterium]|nr:hypothetical protein [Clostridia bacterium]